MWWPRGTRGTSGGKGIKIVGLTETCGGQVKMGWQSETNGGSVEMWWQSETFGDYVRHMVTKRDMW